MNRCISEFALITKYFAPLAEDPAALSLRDDACLLEAQSGQETVITTDALVEGVHFLSTDPPDLIAQKALRVNLSDLAAKGAEPRGYLLALALPRHIEESWLAAFAQGLGASQKAFGTSLLGGDTTATPGPLTIAITALGTLPKGSMIRRSGARPGDSVFVSGTIGDAGAGLAVLLGESTAGLGAAFLIERYRCPTPRLALGEALRGIATASLDVSDGLIADLGHIAEVSGVAITLEAAKIPLSAATAALWPGEDGILRAAASGDDYEIAFTAASEPAVFAATAQSGVPVTRIGTVLAGSGVQVTGRDGQPLPLAKRGYVHF